MCGLASKKKKKKMCAWKSLSHVQLFVTPARILCPWNSPGQNTGVGSCSLLQGIFPTQGLNPGLLHWGQIWRIREVQEHWSGQSIPSSVDLPNPGIKPESPALQMDSLPAELPGKPKNTGVGSLSLLQGIFSTQELKRGLLHCRLILYQLSYEGSL